MALRRRPYFGDGVTQKSILMNTKRPFGSARPNQTYNTNAVHRYRGDLARKRPPPTMYQEISERK
eukprot:2033801-Pyramimonas_sp.AAC.1